VGCKVMAFPGVLKNKRPMLALVATLLVLSFVGLASTQWGRNLSSELGVQDSIAQTVTAAGNAAKQTSAALNSFIGRSPGERGATDVIKGKAKRLAKRYNNGPTQRALGKIFDQTPSQRALGKIFNQPVDGAPELVSSQPSIAVLPTEILPFTGPVPGITTPVSGSPGIFVPASGGSFIGGGGAPGGGGGTGSGGIPGAPPPIAPPAVIPPIISAVPEPSTWILLLFGFGAIGAALRRTKATSKRAGLCALH
jgi:PEP-CTERM motif